MKKNKKAAADKFIVFNEVTYKKVGEFNNLNEALERSYDSGNYQLIVLDKDGENISIDYWKENY